MLNKDFLRQILTEDKKLLALSEVRWTEVPKLAELSVSNLFNTFKQDVKFMAYIPDRLPKGRLPDRSYFFNILSTLYYEYTQELIRVATNHRHQASSAQNDSGTIHVSDEWWKKLNAIPFSSCKFLSVV